MPVAQKERPLTPAKDPKAADKGKAKDKGKGKGAKDKDKDKSKDGSRPPSQQFDGTKSNWTLRIVSDGSLAVRFSSRQRFEFIVKFSQHLNSKERDFKSYKCGTYLTTYIILPRIYTTLGGKFVENSMMID